jgi:hypothetical protein
LILGFTAQPVNLVAFVIASRALQALYYTVFVDCSAASCVTPITCNFACSSVVERADQAFLYSERAG